MGGVKNTPMRDFHTEMGAKMVPFSGWSMPYAFPEGWIAEHKHTRTSCSIFDNTPAGKFQISGGNAAQMLDHLLFAPVSDMCVGECRNNLLLSEEGGVLEALKVCRMREEDFFLTGNAANVLKLVQMFQATGLPFRNLTEDLAEIDIQGPKTLEVLEQAGANPATFPAPNHVGIVELDGLRVIARHTGFTGEEGFELILSADSADQIWDLFLDSEVVEPAGLAARDTLRMERGIPVYGAELRGEWSPLDSGLEAMSDLSAPRDFTGKTALLTRPRLRRFAGAKLESKHAPYAGAEVLNLEGKQIGIVTSGVFSPTLGCAIVLCSMEYVFAAKTGDSLLFCLNNETIAGKICETPFL